MSLTSYRAAPPRDKCDTQVPIRARARGLSSNAGPDWEARMTHLFHESVVKPRQKPAMRGGPQDIAGAPDNGLMEAGRAIIADAQFALGTPDFTEAERVHAVRRAFKRWRALLRLLRRPVGEAADAMRAEARELMRQLATARDQQGALDALADLAKGDAPISPASLQTMRERLTAL